jgi:hypothetical protein
LGGNVELPQERAHPPYNRAMNKSVRVAPSILAADFANLGDSVGRLGDTVGMLHVDVMDGHFVPNISLGPPSRPCGR